MDSDVIAVVLVRGDIHALARDSDPGQPADYLVRLLK
jgi:hypothetical protein